MAAIYFISNSSRFQTIMAERNEETTYNTKLRKRPVFYFCLHEKYVMPKAIIKANKNSAEVVLSGDSQIAKCDVKV